MRTASSRPTPTFLAHTGLLAVVLAIIVGMVGMHVTAGPFSDVSFAGGRNAPDLIAAPFSSHISTAQTTMRMAGQTTSIRDSAEDTHTPCADISPCPEMNHLNSVCLPAPGGTAWTTPLPGLSPLQQLPERSLGPPLLTCKHLPASPSPSELSISRT